MASAPKNGQSPQLQKAIADREKRIETLAGLITLAFDRGRKNFGDDFEARVKGAIDDEMANGLDPVIANAGLTDLRVINLVSLIQGSFRPIAAKIERFFFARRHARNP